MVIRYYIQPVSGMTATQASATIGANGISSIYGTTDMNADTVVGFTYPSITTRYIVQVLSSCILME